MITFNHLDRIDQAAKRIEALSLAAGAMAAARIDPDLIDEITSMAADLAACTRSDVAALLNNMSGGAK